jgi:hypothetical protein
MVRRRGWETFLVCKDRGVLTTPPLGPIVQIAPGEVMFTDADAFRRVGSARGGYRKSEWYECFRFTPGQDHLISMRDDETRRVRKAKLATGVSETSKLQPAATLQLYPTL